ncbi:unnamed protein product [Chrysodeixis includens]|uniref:Uncharacterized protein n=1 Tax=Chrysodeixis includens TaxID=689277 RepID=A0A9N8Q0U2_CHRIL|nr:unnamed protein product [Chrysodeixis includens]
MTRGRVNFWAINEEHTSQTSCEPDIAKWAGSDVTRPSADGPTRHEPVDQSVNCGESNTAGEPSGLIIDTAMGIGRDAAIPPVTRPSTSRYHTSIRSSLVYGATRAFFPLCRTCRHLAQEEHWSGSRASTGAVLPQHDGEACGDPGHGLHTCRRKIFARQGNDKWAVTRRHDNWTQWPPADGHKRTERGSSDAPSISTTSAQSRARGRRPPLGGSARPGRAPG